MAHYCEKVREFHHAFGCAAPSAPIPADDQTRLARIQLVTEETGELMWACAAGDLIKVLDGLGDLEYVLCGTIVAYGGDKCGHPIPNEPSSAFGPPRIPHADVSLQLSSVMLDGASTLAMALSTNDWVKVVNVAASQLVLLGKVWGAFGISEHLRQAVLAEIHRSNMTKFDADGKPVVNEAGRVVKGPNYVPPDIHQVLIEEYGHGYRLPPLRAAVSTPLSGALR